MQSRHIQFSRIRATASSSVSRSSRTPNFSAKLKGRQSAAILRSILDKVLPGRITLPSPVDRQGQRSFVYQASASATPLIIKLTTNRNSFPIEAWVYRKLGNADVPVPEVRYYSANLPRLALPCLVISMIDGMPLFAWDASGDDQRLYLEVGGLLSRVHAVALPVLRFGLGAFVPLHVGATYANWAAFVAAHHAHPASGRYLLEHGMASGLATPDLEEISARIAAHRFSAVLNHGDFGPDHILVRDGRIGGLIDPGEAFAGPPEYDLAYLGCYIAGRQFNTVIRGYRRPLDLPMVCTYAVLIAMHKAARAHRAGQMQRARHFCVIARTAWRRLIRHANHSVDDRIAGVQDG